MSAIDTSPSSNGRGSDAWSGSWTHLSIDRRSGGYCRVTFDHPPINAITAEIVAELAELVGLIDQDPDLNVVVFASANPAFYLAHYDADHDPRLPDAWPDLLARLSRAPALSIAAIRGRVRGAGTEFALACDLRLASRENTLLGPFDLAAGPRLCRLIGRARALEILLAGCDVDGRAGEQHGYVNRAIADDELDGEVDALAARLARFDHDAIVRAKSCVDAGLRPGSAADRAVAARSQAPGGS